MPKHYCDYCDVFLTHDSTSVRKAHNSGRNHLSNVRDYYASLGHDKAQNIIDQITAAYETSGGPPPGGFGFGPQHLGPGPPMQSQMPFGGPPPGFNGPPPGFGGPRPPFPPGPGFPPMMPPGAPPFPPGGVPPGMPPPGMGPPGPFPSGMPPGLPPFPPNANPSVNGASTFPPPNFNPGQGPPPGAFMNGPQQQQQPPQQQVPSVNNSQNNVGPGPSGMHPDRLRMIGR